MGHNNPAAVTREVVGFLDEGVETSLEIRLSELRWSSPSSACVWSPPHEGNRETEDRPHQEHDPYQHGCDDRDLGDACGHQP